MGLVPLEERISPTISWDQVPKVIETCHANKLFPVYHLDKSGALKKNGRRDWDQDGYPYCWAYGACCAIMASRASLGYKDVVRLSPFSLAWLVNYRMTGYYLDETLAACVSRGVAPVEYVPEYNRNPSTYKENWQDVALDYRVQEWWDIDTRKTQQDVTIQCLAVLSAGVPLYAAYNWWGHAICISGMTYENGTVGWIVENSHGESGPIIIKSPKGVPDEAYAPRVITVAG